MATFAVTLADLNAAVANAAAAAPAPTSYNGSLGNVDMSKPVDYTGDWGKVLVTTGRINLAHQLDYLLWLAQGKPLVATPITDAHLAQLIPAAREAIGRDRVYTVLYLAGVPLNLRGTDIISYNVVTPAVRQGRARDELYRLLTNGEAADAVIAVEARWVIHALVANAIHRAQNEGHNWFTAETRNTSHPTGRAVAVAGRDKDEFAAYMERRGHDGNHHLTSESLSACANALTGLVPADIPSILADGTAAPRVMYAGENIRNRSVHEIFVLNDAAIDRWPADQLGKAALIVGLEIMTSVVSDITTRILVTNVNGISSNATIIASAVKTNDINRDDLVALNNALGDLIAWSNGYATTASLIEEGAYRAFDAHAARSPSARAKGASIAKAVRATTPHAEAVGTAVVAAINDMAVALAAAAGSAGNLPSALVVHDPTAVTAAIGRSNADRMMDAMAARDAAANRAAVAPGAPAAFAPGP